MSSATLKGPAKAAVHHVGQMARKQREASQSSIGHLLTMSDVDPVLWQRCRERLLTQAPIALHFHPDRPANGHGTVAQGLFQSGHYQNQFETGHSNGLLEPSANGARARWEDRLFGDAYRQSEALTERPKYGAWHLWPHSDGPSPRFGSCYFLLHPQVTARATLCFGDSHRPTESRGTRAEPDSVLAALLTECFERDSALGVSSVPLSRWIERMSASPAADWLDAPPCGNLDHYVEAQVHGDVRLDRDVATLVADPSFIGTETGNTLEAMARRYGFELAWHGGYRVKSESIPRDRRGPLMPGVAEQVEQIGREQGQGGWVDASHIGLALADSMKNPSAWGHWGIAPSQLMKWLWHVLVMSAR
ncbi:DUF3626 domain-containing protein [Marinobacter hydrocarbonoclasticus]|nr:DUF3626 domain-containing protein [Marinobacter nauticus]